jgi:hypothetical protein
MEELKTKYIIKILPNGTQCLSANTGLWETIDKDSNVYEFSFEHSINNNNNNNHHFIDDCYPCKKEYILDRSNIPFLRHSPISYENNLDKLFCAVHITAH